MKKGQMEIIGLMIVVVIIIIGGLFYIKFNLLTGSEKQDVEIKHMQSIEASNILGAIMKGADSWIICEDKTLVDGIAGCEKKVDVCGKIGCVSLENELKKMLESVTDRNYTISIKRDENVFFSSGSCDTGISSGYFYLTTDFGVYGVQLMLCD